MSAAAAYFERIEAASVPEDLFTSADTARATYRRFARIVHPDVATPKDRAALAFDKLTLLWDEFNGKSRTAPKPSGLVYETKRHVFAVTGKIARGDISNVYRADYGDGVAVLKLPRSPKNSDLVLNEISALKTLAEKVPEEYRAFHPTLVDSFKHRDSKTGKDRQAVVLEHLDGFVSLVDIAEAFPNGVGGRHIGWIGRRLWIALDTAHEAGLVHTAVFPEHVMVHPIDHNLVLIDWSYAVEHGEKPQTAVKKRFDQGWYGAKQAVPADHRLDVYQAAMTLRTLIGSLNSMSIREDRAFRAFFRGCQVASTPSAGQLFQEFDELLRSLYGPRRYVPLEMPAGWTKETV